MEAAHIVRSHFSRGSSVDGFAHALSWFLSASLSKLDILQLTAPQIAKIEFSVTEFGTVIRKSVVNLAT